MYRESLYCPMLERVLSCAAFPKIYSEGEQYTSSVKTKTYIIIFPFFLHVLRDSFPTSFVLGAIAGHPSELCVATGNERGEVEVWYGWTGRRQQPVKTVLHWHAHAVADLCFTTDGLLFLLFLCS